MTGTDAREDIAVPPRTLYLTGVGGGAGRYRCEHAVEQHELFGGEARALDSGDPAALDAIAQAERVVLHRVPLNRATRALVDAARRRGQPVIYDTDDLIFLTEEVRYFARNKGTSVSKKLVRAQRDMLATADLVTCTTEPIAGAARRIARNVAVLPNAVSGGMERASADLRRRARGRGDPERVVVGYGSGSPTHDADFAVAVEGVLAALAADSRIVLRLVGPLRVPRALRKHPRVQHVGMVDFASWLEVLASFDISLAPLEVGVPFCESKSELKFFEAAYLGVPTVASPTAVFREAIADGENGLLAGTAEEWATAVRELAEAPERRRELASKALADASRRHSPFAAGKLRMELLGAVTPRADARGVSEAGSPH